MAKPEELVKAEIVEVLCTRYGYTYPEAASFQWDPAILRHMETLALLTAED
jgi:hypothetical protein